MNAITLQEIESYDAKPQKMGDESRFLCSLSASCRVKPHDAAHRSLCVNTQNGFYNCHRCGAKGKLKDFWDERPPLNKRQMARIKLAAQFSAPPGQINEEATVEHIRENWTEKMKSFQASFAGSAGEKYLERRGIPSEIGRAANCGYAPNWEHWEKREGKWSLAGVDKRVVFPICDKDGEMVAIHGRAIDNDYFASPKITKGDKSLGVFLAQSNVLNAKVTAICEGATDALALAACGLSAVAMTGTTAPDWLFKKLAFRAVLIATDSDEAGDKAAAKLNFELEMRAVKTFRLRPRGCKDWAEVLEKRGLENLKEYLAPFSSAVDDEVLTNSAWHFFQKDRNEAAQFLTNLIENGEVREYLRERMRQATDEIWAA
ncbi:MAG: toprim domain-containing protein [Pyrinomonadaceae bacterium]